MDHVPDDSRLGPYTVLDLHDLPEDGKGFELADGWLVEVAAGARHTWIARRLARIIESAVDDSSLVLDGGEWEVSVGVSVRKPDIIVLPRDLARAVIIDQSPKLIPSSGVELVVEVVSPGSGSERSDRVRKMREYAAVGIPEYWIVDPLPEIRIHRMLLSPNGYQPGGTGKAGSRFDVTVGAGPECSLSFDPGELLDI